MDLYYSEQLAPFHRAAKATNTFTTKQDVSPSPLPIVQGAKIRETSSIEIFASGDYTTTGTPTLVLGFWYGTSTGTITGDIALSSVITTATATAWPWEMRWEGICTGTGVSGSFLGQGVLRLGSSLIAFNADVPIPITAALRTITGFDTTIARCIGVSATWSVSNALNQITVNKHRVNIFN